MEVCVGGLVHVFLRPFLEGIRIDSLAPVVFQLLPVEIMTDVHLEEAVYLLAHMYNLTTKL